MSKFDVKIINNQPIIDVIVHSPSNTFNTNMIRDPKFHYKALVDTGATNSVISSKVVKNLSLQSVGERNITTASHQVVVMTYASVITIPVIEFINSTSAEKQLQTKMFTRIVTEMPALSPGYDILLGMDIIKHCVLIIHNDQCIFSF